MKRFFSFGKIQDQGFRDFLKDEKLSFNNFFLIYIGSLLVCFLLGSYLEVLHFSPLLATGNMLLVWAGWLAISYSLANQGRFERLILNSNNLILAFFFFQLAFLSPQAWVVILLPFFILALLLINFMQGNFHPYLDSIILGLSGIIGLIFFYQQHSEIFQGAVLNQLTLLFLMIMGASGAVFFVWNGTRVLKSLQKIYRHRRELEETATVLEIRIRAKTRELQEQAELLREENRLKTQALRRRIDELERFRRIVVGREMKMIELKEKIARTKKEIGELKKTSHEK